MSDVITVCGASRPAPAAGTTGTKASGMSGQRVDKGSRRIQQHSAVLAVRHGHHQQRRTRARLCRGANSQIGLTRRCKTPRNPDSLEASRVL